jgi:hypothetical protein
MFRVTFTEESAMATVVWIIVGVVALAVIAGVISFIRFLSNPDSYR